MRIINYLAARAELQKGRSPEEFGFFDLMCAINMGEKMRMGGTVDIKNFTKGRYKWQRDWIERKTKEYCNYL